MRHTSSVEVAYHCAQHVRDVLPPSHTHPRPTPGHTPHKAPTNVSHPRQCSPGPDPTHMEERPLGLLRHSRSQQHTPPKPSTDIIELGRRTTRSYPNPTNHQPRIPLIAKGLDAPPTPNYEEPLMDMVPGRSKKVFTTWLASQSDTWRERIERACSISLRWMDSPALRAQPPKNSPARGRSWIPSTSCTLPAMLSMSAAGTPGKNFTIGAGVPRIPCTRPAVCSTPAHAYSPHASNTRSSTCSPAIATSHSRSPGASTRTSPGAYRDPSKIRGKALMQAEINTLTSTHIPRSLTELMTLGRTLTRRAGDTPGLLRPPPHHRRSHRSHQRPPRTLTRLCPRIPKPHPLHHPLPPRNRRIQTPTTPSIMKSP